MTYITNKSLTVALAAIEPQQTLIETDRIDGYWFLTVCEVAS